MWIASVFALLASCVFTNSFPHKQIQQESIYDSVPAPAVHKNIASASTSSFGSSSSSFASSSSASAAASAGFTPHQEASEKILILPNSFAWGPILHVNRLGESDVPASSASATTSLTSSSATSAASSLGGASYATASANGGVSSVPTPTKFSLNPSNLFLSGPAIDLYQVSNIVNREHASDVSSIPIGTLGSSSSAILPGSPAKPMKIALNPSNIFLFGSAQDFTTNVQTAVSSAVSSSEGHQATAHVLVDSPISKPEEIALNPSNAFLYGPIINTENVASFQSTDKAQEYLGVQASSAVSSTSSGTSASSSVTNSQASATSYIEPAQQKPTKITFNPTNVFLVEPALSLDRVMTLATDIRNSQKEEQHISSAASSSSTSSSSGISSTSDGVISSSLLDTRPPATVYLYVNPLNPFLYGPVMDLKKIANYNENVDVISASQAMASSSYSDGSSHSFASVQGLNTASDDINRASYGIADGSGLSFSKVVHGPSSGYGYAGAFAAGDSARVQAASGYTGFAGSSGETATADAYSAGAVSSAVASASSGSRNYANDQLQQVLVLDGNRAYYDDQTNLGQYGNGQLYSRSQGQVHGDYSQAFASSTADHQLNQASAVVYPVTHEVIGLFRDDDDRDIYATHEHWNHYDEHDDHEDEIAATYGISYDDFGPRRENIQANVNVDIPLAQEAISSSAQLQSKTVKEAENTHGSDSRMDESHALHLNEGKPLEGTGLYHTEETAHIESATNQTNTSQSSQSSESSNSSTLVGDQAGEKVQTEAHTQSISSSSSSSSSSLRSKKEHSQQIHIISQ